MLTQNRHLPLYTALVAFAVYVCTMGGGLTLYNLILVPKLAGWDFVPMTDEPLVWVLTLPLRLLPAGMVPVAVKLFSAALAAGVLALLTRTLQLLPWDHPWDKAGRVAGTLPILAAGVACGCELSFWQEATNSCAELLDLLLLASVLWMLLEYNVRQQQRWLDAAALVWGLGMAENWVMLLALPLFVAAVIWLERLRFFRWEFVLRMALLGIAGFLIYALPPTINGLLPHSPFTFGASWLATLRHTKNLLVLLYSQFWRNHRLLVLATALCFLAPTLPLLVRMRDDGTANRSGVDQFQVWLYRLLRLGLLAVCCWLVFDPIPSARHQVQQQLGIRLPLLTFDYLNALGIGFLLGNLLLISQIPNQQRWMENIKSWSRFIAPVAAAGVGLIAAGLVARNAPAILRVNFHSLDQFGELARKSLPPGGGVILSDFPDRLVAVEAALARHPLSDQWIAVDTTLLPTVVYRERLQRLQPFGWLAETNRHELTPLESLRLLQQIAQAHRLVYLHASFGHFFEGFYAVPTGAIYELKLRAIDPLAVPPISAAAVQTNEQFWSAQWDGALAGSLPAARRPDWVRSMAKIGLAPPAREQDRILNEWSSISIDSWGVALQKAGHLHEAQVRLQEALELNTNNLSARITLACNTNLQAGSPLGIAGVERLADLLGNPDRINLLLKSGGPFDEPTVNYLLGMVFLRHGLLVESAEQFQRVCALAPGTVLAEIPLAEVYNRLQMPDRARQLVTHVREETRNTTTNSVLDLNLALLDSYSYLLQTNSTDARDVLESLVRQHPDDPQIAARVLAAYVAINDLTNAMQLVDAQVAKNPDDVAALNAKAFVLIRAGRPADAVQVLDRVLTLTNDPAALVNRAFARVAAKDYPAAESDFNELGKHTNAVGVVNFGRAMIAENRLDTNSAIRYLKLCLTNTPVGAPLWQQASARLSQLSPPAK